MNIADNLKAVTKKADAAQKALKKELQAAFNEAAQAFFVQAPDGTTLTWCQYTPYFNDGDPCTFRVNKLSALIEDPEKIANHAAERKTFEDKQAVAKALSEEQRKALGVPLEEWEKASPESLCNDEYVSTYGAAESIAKYGKDCWDALNQLGAWVTHKANKDTMEAVFGDHVTVTITRDGVKVTDYEHD